MEGLIEKVAEGQWPASAELSADAGLDADFDLGEVVVDKVIGLSATVDRAFETKDLIMDELRHINPLALTPIMVLSLINDWRNRLLSGRKVGLG